MFVGRKEQLDRLNSLWRKNSASLVVISGRRRIGKSTLVEEFALRSKCRFIEIEGLADDGKMSNRKQIDNFCERLAHATGAPMARADSWPAAFDALEFALKDDAKTIVFLDEISWMGKRDSSFAAFLKSAWDTQFSRHRHVILVLAASVSAWIQENILHSKAFVGRVSVDIMLQELSLSECCQFWGEKATRVNPLEMLDVLSVTGGVPKYLQEMDPSLSAEENIRRMCFLPDGYLFKDFERIFQDSFMGTLQAKAKIVEVLAEGAVTVSELAMKLGVGPNGHLTEDLKELSQAGFVAPSIGLNPETGRPARAVRYRLKDNYVRFYLKYIRPRYEAIQAGLYHYRSLEQMAGIESVFGLQLENLVLNNLKSLCPLIGLGPQLILSAAPYFRKGGKRGAGVQVDLLIQTPKSAYVIEIKRRKWIGIGIEDEVREKVVRLGLGRDKSVRTVLVYAGELSAEVEERGYFDYLVPVEALVRNS